MNEAGWNQEYESKSKLERPGAIRTIGFPRPFEFTELVASNKRAHEDSGDPHSLFRHHRGGIMRQQRGSLHNGNNDKSKRKLFHSACQIAETTSRGQGRRQLREIGGAKLKSGGQRFSPNFSGRNQKKKKKSSPKSEGFFWPKSQIWTFFPPNNSNFFLPKKFRGGARKKSGGHCPPAGDAPARGTTRCRGTL